MLEDYIKTLNEAQGITEQEIEMNPQLVLSILNRVRYPETEFEGDENLKVEEYEVYETYKFYGLDTEAEYIIPEGDYLNILQELSEYIRRILPDDFEGFFDSKALYEAELDNPDWYLTQTIAMINKYLDEDLKNIIKKEFVEFNGINYVIVELD